MTAPASSVAAKVKPLGWPGNRVGVEFDVAPGLERQRPRTERKPAGRRHGRERAPDGRHVARHRVGAEQSRLHRDVGAVAAAGLGERSVEAYADAAHAVERRRRVQQRRRIARRRATARGCGNSTARHRS